MNNFCTNCGKPLSQDAKFCANCGTPIAIISPTLKTTDLSSIPASSIDFSNIGKQIKQEVKKYVNIFTSTSLIKLGLNGHIKIDSANKTFHIELYDTALKGLFFQKMTRTRKAIKKTYKFSQLLNFKIEEQHNPLLSSDKAFLKWNKQIHEYILGIDIIVDDLKVGIISVKFGRFTYLSTITDEKFSQASIASIKYLDSLQRTGD